MPELTLALLEPDVVLELAVDALADEEMKVTGAVLETVPDRAVVAAEELVDAFVEEPALDGILEGVVEAGGGVDPDEEPDAARAGAAATARQRRWLSFILGRARDEKWIGEAYTRNGLVISCSRNHLEV